MNRKWGALLMALFVTAYLVVKYVPSPAWGWDLLEILLKILLILALPQTIRRPRVVARARFKERITKLLTDPPDTIRQSRRFRKYLAKRPGGLSGRLVIECRQQPIIILAPALALLVMLGGLLGPLLDIIVVTDIWTFLASLLGIVYLMVHGLLHALLLALVMFLSLNVLVAVPVWYVKTTAFMTNGFLTFREVFSASGDYQPASGFEDRLIPDEGAFSRLLEHLRIVDVASADVHVKGNGIHTGRIRGGKLVCEALYDSGLES